MREHDTVLPEGRGAEIEADARWLLRALDCIGGGRARDCARYRERLRFAIARVEELRREAETAGGVFVPARLEVAIAILESHVRGASGFVRRASLRVAVAEDEETPERDERAA